MLPFRSILMTVLCAMASLAVCAAQVSVSFSTKTSNSATGLSTGGTPSNIYTADLNNDGIPDIIQDVGSSPAKFAVSIAKGDGKFKAPVQYYYPGVGTATPRAAMAFGDFNGDGNIDVVAAVIGTRKVAVYLGNGDGTLQAPKINTVRLFYGNPNLPDTISPAQVAAVDLNKDGKLDLILAGGFFVYGLPGNGDGTFVTSAFLTATDDVPATFHGLVTGDFDGDGNIDVALSYSCDISYIPPCDGLEVVTVVHGDGKFENWGGEGDIYHLLKTYVPFIVGAADLNGDGRTDLIAILPGSSSFLGVWYGQADRTFKGYTSGIASASYGTASGLAPQFVVGDFNDDRHMDFAISAGLAGAHYLQFFLGTSSLGRFTTQAWNLPQYANQTNPVAGIFNRDLKPDVALVRYNSAGTGNSVITTGLNTTQNGSWSYCPYPLLGRGISLCSPTASSYGAITSPVDFAATARSFGEIREMELWIDGKQLTSQYNVWENNAFLNSTATLPAGAHQGEIVATDIDTTQQQLNFDFIVGASKCSPPATNAVRICSVVPGDSAVLVQAAATVSGTLARMEVWADGSKMYTEKSSPSLSASIGLTPGTHQLTVLAVNTSGTTWNQAAAVTVP